MTKEDMTPFEDWYERNDRQTDFQKNDHVELLIASLLLRGVIDSVAEDAIYLTIEQRKNLSDPADAWEPVQYQKKLSLFEMRCYCHEVRR